MQTAVALLITGNVNKKAVDCQTTQEHQESSGHVNKILWMGSQALYLFMVGTVGFWMKEQRF